MYIRKTTHTENKTGKRYDTYKLVETIRTDRGPRQRAILNLGANFAVPKEKWNELAFRSESILSGQLPLFAASEDIKQHAQRYANRIIACHSQNIPPIKPESSDYQTVDINSLENEKIRKRIGYFPRLNFCHITSMIKVRYGNQNIKNSEKSTCYLRISTLKRLI